ncbi:hypothetical protein [Phaeovulum sp.]|uniref:hypothetical protein n=1 Tax=Phaeovulum sp. TaxID=2934796 RepID=UPI0039E40150
MTITSTKGNAASHASPDTTKGTRFMFILALAIVLVVAGATLVFGLVGLILSGVIATAVCMGLLVLMTAGG